MRSDFFKPNARERQHGICLQTTPKRPEDTSPHHIYMAKQLIMASSVRNIDPSNMMIHGQILSPASLDSSMSKIPGLMFIIIFYYALTVDCEKTRPSVLSICGTLDIIICSSDGRKSLA